MSYILDALKKSEQQRQIAEVPSLYTAQIAAGQHSKPVFVVYVIAAALISAGILIGWWHPWQATQTSKPTVMPPPANDTTSGQTQPLQTPPLEAQPLQISPLTTQAPPPSPRKFEPLPPVTEASSTTPSLPKPDKKKRVPQNAPVLPKSPAPLPAPPSAQTLAPPPPPAPLPAQATAARVPDGAPSGANTPAGLASTESPEKQKIVALEDLPPEVRQELPPMAISGFTYSEEPKQRIVGINDRLLQEGQNLAPGLKLEQIGPDGLVFSYRDYRFRKSLP